MGFLNLAVWVGMAETVLVVVLVFVLFEIKNEVKVLRKIANAVAEANNIKLAI